tara:strand:+ start:823 stop:927 length:105 start_codon:yes stop_codon:yes gene_type:complete
VVVHPLTLIAELLDLLVETPLGGVVLGHGAQPQQ